MLTRPEQKTVLAMVDKLVRAAVLAEQKQRERLLRGMSYDEAHQYETMLRVALVDLLKEVGA